MPRVLVSLVLATLHSLPLTAEESRPTVKVAAIQCPSVMGKTSDNLRLITNLIYRAAGHGVKIAVFPECAVHGYMDPITWRSWSRKKADPDHAKQVAETVPGPSTRLLGELAYRFDMYIAIGLIEVEDDAFYNTQVLLGPDGGIKARHRKQSLWTPGDSRWCTKGDRPVQVVDSPFGRLGLMICYDFHDLPPQLAEKRADIVLYSVGWYGPNEKQWFSKTFPEKAVVPHGFDIIVANWAAASPNTTWPGRGHSCIITRKGRVQGMAETVHGSEIVMTDLEIRKP